jgi:hypothetical protein
MLDKSVIGGSVAICQSQVTTRYQLVRRAKSECLVATHPSLFALTPSTFAQPHTQRLHLLDPFKMSNEEEQYEDSTMGGPGAPTPVSALEVRFTQPTNAYQKLT